MESLFSSLTFAAFAKIMHQTAAGAIAASTETDLADHSAPFSPADGMYLRPIRPPMQRRMCRLELWLLRTCDHRPALFHKICHYFALIAPYREQVEGRKDLQLRL